MINGSSARAAKRRAIGLCAAAIALTGVLFSGAPAAETLEALAFTTGDPPGLVVEGSSPGLLDAGPTLNLDLASIPSLRQGVRWRGKEFTLQVALLSSPGEAERALVRYIGGGGSPVDPGPLPGKHCPGEECWQATQMDVPDGLWFRRGSAVIILNGPKSAEEILQDLAVYLAGRVDSYRGPAEGAIVEPPFAAGPDPSKRSTLPRAFLGEPDLPGWIVADSGWARWPVPQGSAPDKQEPLAAATRFSRRDPTLEDITLVYQLLPTEAVVAETFQELKKSQWYQSLADLPGPTIEEWLGGCPGDECIVLFRPSPEFRVAVRIGRFTYLVRRNYVARTSGGHGKVISECGQLAWKIASRYREWVAGQPD